MSSVEYLPALWQQAIPELGPLVVQIQNSLSDEADVRPQRGLWFEAMRRVSPQRVSVVLLGQDPYHGEDNGLHQAHGLSFSVPHGVKPPPSLRNILTELAEDTGNVSRVTGDLSTWADQGVLLLNASLTTRGGVAGAHRKIWYRFTTLLLEYLGKQAEPLVFILWGADAQNHKALIAAHHVVIESVHPSPLSSYRGFFGSKPFSQCNDALVKLGKPQIGW